MIESYWYSRRVKGSRTNRREFIQAEPLEQNDATGYVRVRLTRPSGRVTVEVVRYANLQPRTANVVVP